MNTRAALKISDGGQLAQIPVGYHGARLADESDVSGVRLPSPEETLDEAWGLAFTPAAPKLGAELLFSNSEQGTSSTFQWGQSLFVRPVRDIPLTITPLEMAREHTGAVRGVGMQGRPALLVNNGGSERGRAVEGDFGWGVEETSSGRGNRVFLWA